MFIRFLSKLKVALRAMWNLRKMYPILRLRYNQDP